MEQVVLNINGDDRTVAVENGWSVLYVLREVLGMTGTKCGCNTCQCGSCKIIVDGEAVNACSVNPKKAVGKKIQTIEGLAKGNKLHPIQQAFIDCGAVQCGFCTPGMIMSAKALLDKIPADSYDYMLTCWTRTRTPPRRRSGRPLTRICAAAPVM